MIVAHLPKVRCRSCDNIELITKSSISQIERDGKIIGIVYNIVDSRSARVNNKVDTDQVFTFLKPLTVVDLPLSTVVDFLNDVTK